MRVAAPPIWTYSLVSALLLLSCTGPELAPQTPKASAEPTSVSIAAPVQADHGLAKIPVGKDDLAVGPWNAPVTLVAFVDLQCPYCASVVPTLARLEHSYPEKLRVVIKHNPLPFHRYAYEAALATATVRALAGNDTGAKFSARVLEHQADLSPQNLERWAGELGVAAVVYRLAMEDRRFARVVDADIELARNVGATGTPSFRINGIALNGSQPYEKFAEVIDQQSAVAAELVASGTAPGDVYPKLCARNVELAPEAPPPDGEAAPDLTVFRVPVHSNDPQRGSSDAKVTLIVFSDFECPYCAQVEPTLSQLRSKYGNDLRIVWKDHPLPFHAQARRAAALGQLVYQRRGNETFWQLHDTLFDQQDKLEAVVTQEAKRYGVSEKALADAQQRGPVAEIMARSEQTADDFVANGTPHFFVNGVRLSGAQSLETFVERIDAALADANRQLAQGVKAQNLYDQLVQTGRGPLLPETKEVALPARPGPSRGSKTAPVTVQLFSDFQCPFCKRIGPILDALEKEFPSQLRIVWRHFPLAFHAQAHLAAEAAEAAYAQKGSAAFWQFHDRLFEAQDTPAGLERSGLESIAKNLGLDLSTFNRALDQGTYRATVDADIEAASTADISGTPATVIGKYFLSGAQPLSRFRSLVRRSLAEAKSARPSH